MPVGRNKSRPPEKAATKKRRRQKSSEDPAGYTKIMEAVKVLLAEKGFQDITWGEIARAAGVSEALIYQYFKTRQGLLYSVLAEYLEYYKTIILNKVDEADGSLNKVRALIYGLLSVYGGNRVFARILLLEVRNFQDYFESEAYAITREFGLKYLTTLEEGVKSGHIRADIPPTRMRQVLLGGVEHAILPYVIFQRHLDLDKLAGEITPLLMDAIRPRVAGPATD
jgi:AcrR family transcriptional regulator